MKPISASLLALSLVAAPVARAATGAPVDDPVRVTSVVQAVQRVAPDVVSISVTRAVNDPFGGFFGPRVQAAEGSGVVIDASGIVLTNAHVVEQAQTIVATFPDKRKFDATVLGIEPHLDLAVLRLKGANGLSAVPIGTSADLMLGEPVIAIGNPMGLGQTVTTGVVSATRRRLETDQRVYQDFIQTDASINPGNSGGPLLNAHGQLIGINTAIRADAQNIGFAIPVDRAMKVARDLMTFGTVQVPWLGVDLSDVRTDNLGDTAARVDKVWDGGSAATVGLRPGDLIVECEGHAVQGRGDLDAHLATFSPGRKLHISYVRDGQKHQVVLVGGVLPQKVVDAVLEDVLGIAVGGQQDAVVQQIYPQGAFARAGLRVGDQVTAINGEVVHSAADLRQALAHAKSGHRTQALFTIARGRATGQLSLPI